MRIACIVLLLVGAGLYSCQWGVPHSQKPAITKDTLKYTYKTLKERAPDCGNKADSACTTLKITYPEFIGQKSLNSAIIDRLDQLLRNDKRDDDDSNLAIELVTGYHDFKGDKPDTSLEQIAENYFESYKFFKQQQPKSTLSFLFDANAKVLRQDSNLITIEVIGYTYWGGAHGLRPIKFINWNTKSGKKITLKDILQDGTYDKLTAIAEKIFRKDEKLSDTASLANDYFFKDGKFHLNDNFLITPTGLRFLYNEYEIKSYAAGRTNLVIPYAQIKDLLQPNTVIRQYIK